MELPVPTAHELRVGQELKVEITEVFSGGLVVYCAATGLRGALLEPCCHPVLVSPGSHLANPVLSLLHDHPYPDLHSYAKKVAKKIPTKVILHWNSVPSQVGSSSSSRRDWCSSNSMQPQQPKKNKRSVAGGPYSKWRSGEARKTHVVISSESYPVNTYNKGECWRKAKLQASIRIQRCQAQQGICSKERKNIIRRTGEESERIRQKGCSTSNNFIAPTAATTTCANKVQPTRSKAWKCGAAGLSQSLLSLTPCSSTNQHKQQEQQQNAKRTVRTGSAPPCLPSPSPSQSRRPSFSDDGSKDSDSTSCHLSYVCRKKLDFSRAKSISPLSSSSSSSDSSSFQGTLSSTSNSSSSPDTDTDGIGMVPNATNSIKMKDFNICLTPIKL